MARLGRVNVYSFEEFEDLIFREGKCIEYVHFEILDGLRNDYLFKGFKFTECSFESIDLARNEFEDVAFEKCNFRWNSFREIDFRKTQFKDCSFDSITFNEVRLAMPAFMENDLDRIIFKNMRFAYEIESTLAIMKVGLDLDGVYRRDPCTYCQRIAVKEDLCVNCWKYQRSRHQNLKAGKKSLRVSKGDYYENFYHTGRHYP